MYFPRTDDFKPTWRYATPKEVLLSFSQVIFSLMSQERERGVKFYVNKALEDKVRRSVRIVMMAKLP